MSGANKKQELAQKARLEREAAERTARERGQRLKLLGGAVVAIVVIVVAVIALGVFKKDAAAGSTESKVKVDGKEVTVKGAAETSKMIAGLPQKGLILGDPNAPATIVEVGDLKCPGCQVHEIDAQPQIVDKLVRTGKANLEFQLVNFRDQAAGTTDGAAARNAAFNLAAKNKFYNFVHTLYFNQGLESDTWATEKKLKAVGAGAPGVGADQVNTRETPQSRAMVAAADKLQAALRVNATPSIYVKARGSNAYTNVPNFSSVDDIAAAVDKASSKASNKGAAAR